MDNHDFSNLGKKIYDTVQDAVDSMDFQQLNQEIHETVSIALEEAKQNKEKFQRQYEQKWQQEKTYNQNGYAKPNYKADYVNAPHGKQQEKAYNPNGYAKPNEKAYNPNGYAKPNYKADYVKPLSRKQQIKLILAPKVKRGSGQIAGGILLSCFFLGMLFVELFKILFSIGNSLTMVVNSVFILVLLAASVGLTAFGVKRKNLYDWAKEYAGIVQGRGFCEIRELALKTNQTEEKVRARLRKMIQKNVFREAYMDKQETCLMVNRIAYNYYLQAEESRQQREEAEERKKQEEQKLSPEVVEMIRKGDEYIKAIREANDKIAGEVISEKLDRLERVVRRIFECVKKYPAQKKSMDKFMDYYMPTTLKLVNTYQDFEAMDVKGENISKAMREIEDTLDTIIHAFEQLLDDLFQDAAFDVSSDISVLQTMLAREGYKEKDFDLMK